jgi:hypothetical protein
VSGGTVSPCDFLREGQRFWVTGSVLNDGVYTYHASGITNDDDCAEAQFAPEEFDGTICEMAVPRELIALSREIAGWLDKYGNVMNSPYQSESFGGYSYTKAAGNGLNQNGGGWQDVYAKRLNTWRKLC